MNDKEKKIRDILDRLYWTAYSNAQGDGDSNFITEPYVKELLDII